jgi:CubicO group peptidase (beta-lactamase class C family)
MKRLVVCLWVGGILTAPHCGLGQDLASQLDSISATNSLMGMSVAAICNGEISALHHTGLRNWESSLPVDNNTRYRIASVSKAITATALLVLHDEGLFNWGDDVSGIVGFEVRNPLFPDVPITIDQLVSHTSSIQDGTGYSDFLAETYNASLPPSVAEVLSPGGSFFTSNMWRTEEPGSFFAYSNMNFVLLGTVMEALTGERFDELMASKLFEPCGLSCSFNVAELPDINDLAVLYRYINGWVPQADDFQGIAPPAPDLSMYLPGTNAGRFAPQGGLRASALDLAVLMSLHINEGQLMGNQLITASAIDSLQSILHLNDGDNGDNYYGLFEAWGRGLHRTTNQTGGDIVFPNDQPMWGHPGEAYGLISDWYFDPAARTGVIFLTNGSGVGYDWGDYSAFYQIEEAVFSAVHDHLLATCSANSIPPQVNPSVRLTDNGSTLHLTPAIDDITAWEIVSLNGQILQTSHPARNPDGSISVKNLKTGTYILRISTPAQTFSIRWHHP